MEYIFCLPCMIFCHVVDDYYLQGILASLKQKNFWEKMDGYNDFYKNDYIAALLFHAFSWSFMTLLPLVIFKWPNLNVGIYCLVLLIQTLIHAFVDNQKANKKSINLIIDQSIHMVQIIASWLIFFFV